MARPGGEMMEQHSRPGADSLICSWGLTALYIVLILMMAARPAPRLPLVKHIDKYLHALAYGVLAVLSYRSFAASRYRRAAVMTLILGTLVGMADEGIQFLNRRRTASRYDLMADVIGVIIGTLAVVWSGRRKTGSGADVPCGPSERSSP